MKTKLHVHPECHRYFPIAKELLKLPRQWIINVAVTVVGEPFRAWVKEQISARNIKVATEKDLNISLDPEIAACFRASNAVSCK